MGAFSSSTTIAMLCLASCPFSARCERIRVCPGGCSRRDRLGYCGMGQENQNQDWLLLRRKSLGAISGGFVRTPILNWESSHALRQVAHPL